MSKWDIFCRVWMVMSAASLAFWAVTGMTLWAPLGHDDEGARFMLLATLHAFPFIKWFVEQA